MDPLSIVGAGYVGLVSAACFASRGHNVVVGERDRERVKLLTKGKTPFYEPGLDGLLKRSASRISFTTDLSAAIQESDLTFVSVGTPSRKDGSIDLSQIKSSLREIGSALLPGRRRLIVVRSTVVPGTTWKVVRPILEKASSSKVGERFLLAMQPEFLREGNAIEDMLHPDRIVIGECSRQAGDRLQRFYEAFYRECRPPILRMNPTSAELVKYASNAFLAMKVSFVNEIANICERLDDVDVVSVAEAVGLDPRIGPKFLNAGVGFGGSCFPKDVRAICAKAKELGFRSLLLPAISEVNERQKRRVVELAHGLVGSLSGKRVALLGLSFKPDTDDMREAPSLRIIDHLRRRGASVVVYDPVAIPKAKQLLDDKVIFASSIRQCLRRADVCIVVTEWNEFKTLTPNMMRSEMKRSILVDGRRIYDRKHLRGITYAAIGLSTKRTD